MNINLACEILVSGIEGGINYWAEIRHYRWNYETNEEYVLKNVSADIIEYETDKVYKITHKDIIKTVKLIAHDKERLLSCSEDTIIQCCMAIYHPDMTDIDSIIADEIIQVALLGQVIYG
jgi:transcriptional antiterminator Rof (Rho-off)